ncbi:FecR family protein [Chitinophaga arvensicola]|uniref:FecR protein n=1 Tax=Chitinophaga arvensicola TaxID=29529 RepID=A0A1I0SB79_9BACT|nr:FecR family protein [Chitinophaga arvensicola]SEW53911.1 FecR protein [Chitinophaga arvensicola]
MTEEEFLIQYRRYLAGELTPGEIAALFAHQDDIQLEAGEIAEEEKEELRDKILKRLQEEMRPPALYPVKRSGYRRWWAAAAVAAIAIGAAFFWQYRSAPPPKNMAVATVHPAGIPKKKTWLTLSNGKMISLSDAGKGLVAATQGASASKEAAGELAYSRQHNDTRAIPDTNSISTPAGEQFTIVLADGSKVKLNTTSSLRYPVFFAGKREVYLSGEACFEVVADPANPFIVHVNGTTVQALGTVFNIKAYPEEKISKTTLVSGAVNVNVSGKNQLLHIGQQLNYDLSGNRYWMKEVNTEVVTAWKEGIFAFENERISDMMTEIGRWYNMDVSFTKGNANRKFSAKIIRYEKINEVLKRLELTGSMTFAIQKNSIIVTIR